MPNLLDLPTHDARGAVRVVVETPAQSPVKLRYDPEVEAFVFGRALVLGVVYPYDWGFVPGTHAADGDPLDAMVIHRGRTHPGVVIPCRPIGAVRVTQKAKRGGRERNDRVVLVPLDEDRLDDVSGLGRRVRLELEQFFLSAVAMEGKAVRIQGWSGPESAKRLIAAAQRTYRRV